MSSISQPSLAVISAENRLPGALALIASLERFRATMPISLCLVDNPAGDLALIKKRFRGLTVYSAQDLCQTQLGAAIVAKYRGAAMGTRIHALKAAFADFLARIYPNTAIVFLDDDIYFTRDYMFLFKVLETYDMFLTVAFPFLDPARDPFSFDTAVDGSLYSAAVLGITGAAHAPLEAWMTALAHSGGDEQLGVRHVDCHLNPLPVYFDNLTVIRKIFCPLTVSNYSGARLGDNLAGVDLARSVPAICFSPEMQRLVRYGNAGAIMPWLSLYDRFRDEVVRDLFDREGNILNKSRLMAQQLKLAHARKR